MSQRSYVELRCPRCPWTEVCGPKDVVRWLRTARKLRAAGQPEWEVLCELLQSAAGQLPCPGCGAVGLVVGPARDDADWPELRRCAACGKTIDGERLEAVPDATLCAACQRAEESGRPQEEIEYCPKCGAPMELRPTRGAGVTRYVMACTAVPPCRLGRR